MARGYPIIGRFVGTGLGLGLILGAVAALFSRDQGDYSGSTTFGYLMVGGGIIGALLGGLVGGLLDVRADRSRRAAKSGDDQQP